MSYRIQSGDTLSAIAARLKVSLSSLEKANPQLKNPNVIFAGEMLNVSGKTDSFQPAPAKPKPAPAKPGAAKAPSAKQPGSYTVRAGDSMSAIAAREGISLGALVQANPQVSNPNLIRVGERLNIPGRGGASRAPAPAAVRTPQSASGGNNAAAVARNFLGESEYKLQPSGALDMDGWVPKSEDCANFVSGCLEKAGLITHAQRSDGVTALAGHLRAAGWHDTPLANAKPGDVVCFDGPGGNYQHVEIFDHWNGNTPVFIGSNNTLSDGTQAIGYDNGGRWAYRFHVLAPPG